MDAKATVLRAIELWNAHDREGHLALYGEGATFIDEPTGQHLTGREAIGKGFYDMWTEAYPDNELRDAVVFGEGEMICFQGRFVGTNTGAFHAPGMTMPPTGKPIDAPFVFVAEVRDGKVMRSWHYYDRLLAFEQEEVLSLDKLFAGMVAA